MSQKKIRRTSTQTFLKMRNMVTEGACDAAHGAVNYAFEAAAGHMNRGRSVKGRNVLFRVASRKDNDFTSDLGHAIQTGDTKIIQVMITDCWNYPEQMPRFNILTLSIGDGG